jgi:putative redox protein
MKAELVWKEKMQCEVSVGGFTVHMDANPPFGDGKHPTPKQLLAASMAGCTVMDVIGLLKKAKQNFTSLRVDVEGEARKEQPQIFTDAVISYFAEGEVAADKFNEAIHLSLTKYCSVNAMISKVVPIRWKSFINSLPAGEGKADFGL